MWPRRKVASRRSATSCNPQSPTPNRAPGKSTTPVKHKPHGVTVKFVALNAVPPGVVMPILPVLAPVGTVAVT